MRLAPWTGPALLLLGLGGILAISLQSSDDRSPLGWWILSNARAYERTLPLVGFGAALGLVHMPLRITALVFFGLGIALGFLFEAPLLSTVALIPGAIAHHFLTGPILSITIGLSLATPGRLRRWVLPVVALVAGVTVGVVIRLTDPSVLNPMFKATGIAFVFWILTGVCLTVRDFRQIWFETAARILGSWLIAIGLLYGGASIKPPRHLALPPRPPTPSLGDDDLTPPGFDKIFPDPRQSHRRQLPEGLDPSRQP
jgi:hypothetical protein